MKTAIVFALLVGLVATTDRPFNFTVYGVGNPAVNIGQYTDQLRPISSYQNVLLSELTHYNSNPSDNNFIFPLHVNPYTSGHNLPGYEPLISPPLSYFRPYSSPHGRPQNLEYFTKFHTSRLYPYYRVNDLIQQFTPFYNSLIGKIHSYNNLNNVRNGPVTVLVQSREDPNKLVAIFVQHGLENLGRNPNMVPLLETIAANVGRRTAFLFNPINTPVSSQKVPVSSYIIPTGMTLAQFAKQAIQAPDTPFLLLIDDSAPLVLDIKSLYQTFKIGSVEVTESAINVIPQFPVQPAVIPLHAGYYQPQYSVASQSQVPTVSGGSSFPSLPVAPTVSVSEVTSSAVSQNSPQNMATSSVSTSPATSHNSNQATVPLSAA